MIATELSTNDSMIILRNHTSKFTAPEPIRSWDVWEKLLLALLIFGLFGNSLTILVMRSKHMRKTNESLFITCIAVLDISLLFNKFFANMQKVYRFPIYHACTYLHFIIPQAIAWLIYWLIVIITIERSIAVIKPLQVNTILSKQRCRVIILITTVTFVLLSCTQLPCLTFYDKKPYYCTLRSIYIYKNSTKSVDVCFVYMNKVFPWVKSAFMSWIPWILAIIFNTVILVNLNKASKLRRDITKETVRRKSEEQIQLNELLNNLLKPNLPSKPQENTGFDSGNRNSSISLSSNTHATQLIQNTTNFTKIAIFRGHLKTYRKILKEKQTTITLCVISISFILFTAPFTIYDLLRKIHTTNTPANTINMFQNRNFHRFTHFLLDCLHVTNFIFYCLIGERFRDALKRIISKKFGVFTKKCLVYDFKDLSKRSRDSFNTAR